MTVIWITDFLMTRTLSLKKDTTAPIECLPNSSCWWGVYLFWSWFCQSCYGRRKRRTSSGSTRSCRLWYAFPLCTHQLLSVFCSTYCLIPSGCPGRNESSFSGYAAWFCTGTRNWISWNSCRKSIWCSGFQQSRRWQAWSTWSARR